MRGTIGMNFPMASSGDFADESNFDFFSLLIFTIDSNVTDSFISSFTSLFVKITEQ